MIDLTLPGAAGQVLVLAAILLGADVLLGVAISLRAGKFDLRLLPNFLRCDVLPYGLGLVVLGALLAALPLTGVEETAGLTAGVGAWALKIAADVVAKTKALFM